MSGADVEGGTLFDGDAIDDLIASLHPHNPPPNHGDSGNVQSLLADANEFVKHAGKPEFTTENKTQKDDSATVSTHEDDEEDSSSDEKDEAEAAKYIERALNELGNSQGPAEPHDPDVDDALQQSLPSVPTDLPTTKNQHNEIQHEFCCVCYDTATTKCLDCDGNQFFCVRCWKEMHEYWTDQPHKSVKYEPYKH